MVFLTGVQVKRETSQRLVCLSAEAALICYQLGAWDQVVGVTAYAPSNLPPRPIVSGFSAANIQKIRGLDPNLILLFSDVQADIARALIRAGYQVLALNPRSISEIAATIHLIGRITGLEEAGEMLAESFLASIENLRYHPVARPRVYFEEWDDPLICGIEWVDELVNAAGGENVFSTHAKPLAEQRVVSSDEVISKDPEIILASWCGKRVNLESICSRPGWSKIRAVKNGHVYAIDSEKILQAGPRLVEGLIQIRDIVQNWRARFKDPRA
jgi:iron complex transport system substrate-binding protein